MSILATNKDKRKSKLRKHVVTYLILTILTFSIGKIYGLFGHGVTSPAMTWMFLYPFIGGGFIYTMVLIVMPKVEQSKAFRIFTNLYNSGIATLTVGSFLRGILDIAGTDSVYVRCFYVIGILFIVIALLWIFSRRNQN